MISLISSSLAVLFLSCAPTRPAAAGSDHGAALGLPAGAAVESLWQYAADLADPAMQGRLTGAPSGRRAEEYVEAAMRALPLEVRLQSVPFAVYEVRPPVAFELPAQGGRPARAFAYLDDFREVDYSGAGEVSGELYFLGHAIDAPGMAPDPAPDLAGKIAVFLSGAPEGTAPDLARLDRKLDYAWRLGARAAVVVPSVKLAERHARAPKEAEMRALDGEYGFHPELHHPDLPVVFVHAHLVETLTGKKTEELAADPAPRPLGVSARLQVNGSVYPEAASRNVIGVLPGVDPELAKEVVLIGAHYDHLGVGGDGRIFCGAADNASGAAVVLEAARAFAGCPVRPKRTLVFALWCGEEQGLHGSKFYCNREPLFPLEDTKLMVQIDYLDDQYGPCVSNVTDAELMQRFLSAAIAEKRVEVLDTQGQCASDDCSFLAKNVPACRFIAFGGHHHQDTDTVASLSRDMLRKTADLVIEGIRNTAY